MRKEDVKVGGSVWLVRDVHGQSKGTVGIVREDDGSSYMPLLVDFNGCTLWLNLEQVEPAEAPQVPSVTINGTVYVPEDTIKAPEPAPALKFFWGQWVKVEGDDFPAIVICPEVDSDGDIRVNFMGKDSWLYRQARLCTPIGA